MSSSRSDREVLPPALRAAVARDLVPVRPLRPPARRAILLAVPALLVFAGAVMVLTDGGSADRLFSLYGGGISLVEWLGGLALLWLALREAVPGMGIGGRRALAAVVAGVALQLVLGLFDWQRTGGALSGPAAMAIGGKCASIVGAIGLPQLAIAIWLALRALPIRPRWSGALAGAAAALLADAIWHLACVRADLQHLLVWHLGATVAMAALGALGGSFLPRLAMRRR